jgi:hypothetical protein
VVAVGSEVGLDLADLTTNTLLLWRPGHSLPDIQGEIIYTDDLTPAGDTISTQLRLHSKRLLARPISREVRERADKLRRAAADASHARPLPGRTARRPPAPRSQPWWGGPGNLRVHPTTVNRRTTTTGGTG